MQYFRKIKGNLSLPDSRKVRGYEIKRMPLGAYITALQRLQNFPQEALEAVFPGKGIDAVIKQLKTIDTAMLSQILIRAFTALPKYAAELIAALTNIPEDRILEDPNIGLDGLAEIIDAWLEVNNIENFINAARSLMAKAKMQAANTSKD